MSTTHVKIPKVDPRAELNVMHRKAEVELDLAKETIKNESEEKRIKHIIQQHVWKMLGHFRGKIIHVNRMHALEAPSSVEPEIKELVMQNRDPLEKRHAQELGNRVKHETNELLSQTHAFESYESTYIDWRFYTQLVIYLAESRGGVNEHIYTSFEYIMKHIVIGVTMFAIIGMDIVHKSFHFPNLGESIYASTL